MKAKSYHLTISPKTQFLNFFRKFFIFSGFDKLLVKLTRNKKMNSIAAKLIPPNYLYKLNTFRKCTINGIHFNVDISDTVGHSNYYALEEAAQKKLFDFVKPGMTVIDIGANIGATTLNIAKRISPDGNIYSFEPSPYNYQQALANISLNNFSNIHLINLGLGDEKTTAFLWDVNSNNRGMQRLLKDTGKNISYEKTSVDVDTLDNSMETFGIPKPSLIKIDVEGYEFKVLQGGMRTILKYAPSLFIELDDNNLREQGNNAKELIESLIQQQYKIINAATGSQVDENTNYANCHFDILCTPA